MESALQSFSDRLGRFFEENGLPYMAGRVFGQLLISDPPEQTFDELVDELGASRSSVSVASRILVTLELIERVGVPGERRDRYRLREDAWTVVLRQDMVTATRLKQLAADGLRLLQSKPRAVRARLQEMQEFYTFLEQAYVPILRRWTARRRAPARRPR